MVRQSTGFTLIEILIVIAIGSVVMTIAAARYNQLTQRKRIEQQTKNTVTFLRKIKKMADSGGRSGCGTGTTLDYFQVWNDAAHSQKLVGLPVCGGASGTPLVLDPQTGTKAQSERQFTFLPLSKGANVVSAGDQTVEISICKSDQNPCDATTAKKIISVDSGGNINEL